MHSWAEIEQRFRALEQSLRGLRLDFQSGDAGEYWNLTGVQRGEAYRECLLLSGVAGKLLGHCLNTEEAPGQRLLREGDSTKRWFLAVKELSGQFKAGLPVHGVDENGNRVETIYTGSMPHYVANSANLCLWLEAEHPVKDSRSFWDRLYEDHGRALLNGTILIIVSAIVAFVINQCSGSTA